MSSFILHQSIKVIQFKVPISLFKKPNACLHAVNIRKKIGKSQCPSWRCEDMIWTPDHLAVPQVSQHLTTCLPTKTKRVWNQQTCNVWGGVNTGPPLSLHFKISLDGINSKSELNLLRNVLNRYEKEFLGVPIKHWWREMSISKIPRLGFFFSILPPFSIPPLPPLLA